MGYSYRHQVVALERQRGCKNLHFVTGVAEEGRAI